MIELLDITEKQYRAHPYRSNSSMNPINPDLLETLGDALRFGTAGHEYLQEFPLSVNVSKEELWRIKDMSRNVRQNPLFSELMRSGNLIGKETKYVNHELMTRSMNDFDLLYNGDKVIIEYKTLSVATEKAFKEAIIRFGYDKGAVHYLLTSGHKYHVIVGASKVYPYRVFTHVTEVNRGIFWTKAYMKWKRLMLHSTPPSI